MLILVLGILRIVVCGLLGPVAWVMGNSSLQEIRAGVMDPREEGLIQAGRIIGMVVTGLMVLGILIYCGIMALACGAVGVAGASGAR